MSDDQARREAFESLWRKIYGFQPDPPPTAEHHSYHSWWWDQAWRAATARERERCAGICKKLADEMARAGEFGKQAILVIAHNEIRSRPTGGES